MKNFKWAALLILGIAAALRIYQIHHYPPGFHYDEAVYYLVSKQIALEGARPFPFYAAYNGREILYMYVSALAIRGIGAHPFTMHMVSMSMNLITLALTLAIGKAAFPKKQGVMIGLVAAGLLAVSFPQIFLARQSFRAVSLPLMQAATWWLLLMSLRRGRGWLISAGFFAGLVLYTYAASRFFPLWLAAAFISILILDTPHWKTRFSQTLRVGIAFAITAAPIAIYFYTHQDAFFDRLNQLDAGENSITFMESVRLHARMFFIEGDPYYRYNEPFAPYFPFGIGLLLVGGWLIAVWRVRQEADPVARLGYVLAAISPLMVLPSLLAVEGMPPSHMRSLGMVPLIFLLPAIGVEFLWSKITMPKQSQAITVLKSGVLIAALLFMAVQVWQRYEKWAQNPALYYETDSDMVASGAWLTEHTDADDLIYVTSIHYDHPSLLMYDLPGENITFLTGKDLFLPPPGREAYLVETWHIPLEQRDSRFMPIEQMIAPDGQVSFTVYQWQGESQTPPVPDETVGGWIALLDSEIPTAQTTATISTRWQVISPPMYADFVPIFFLQTPEGEVIARSEPYLAESNRWRAGETLLLQAEMEIPPGTPPGDYTVKVTWVGRAANHYVGRISASGNFAGIETELGQLRVERAETAAELEVPPSPSADLGAMRLLGWSSLPESIRPGERIHLDLFWQALEKSRETTLEIEALSETGEAITLWEAAPNMDRYPFAEWEPGETVVDRHRWRVPTDLPAGHYTLRLQVAGEQVELGQTEVLEVNRVFDMPSVQTPLLLNFGGLVELVGYDLAWDDTLELTLYWKSLAETDLPLTVFVHVVGADGQNAAQRDTQPRENTYPVALWLPGEYVADHYSIPIAAGDYTLRVGMYLQSNGQRLEITDGNTSSDAWNLTE